MYKSTHDLKYLIKKSIKKDLYISSYEKIMYVV